MAKKIRSTGLKLINIYSLLNGINSWFNRSKNNPFDSVIANLELLKKDLPRFFSADSASHLLTPAEKEKYIGPIKNPIVKKLNIISNHLIDFETRFKKIDISEISQELTLRNPVLVIPFYQSSRDVGRIWNSIKSSILDSKLPNKSKKEKLKKIDNLITDLPRLKSLFNLLIHSLSSRKFNSKNAHISFDAPERTCDGIAVNKILRLAKGLGFEVSKSSKHRYTINLEDGQPCALGKTTDWIRHVRGRIAKASQRSPKEISELLTRI